ncbi:MAG TPA: single-stranded DNA-binding protein [Blastocatellia bacterium]|nr:single-stranded DNA-binding protein [Blastocatellia bacterium]
MASFLKGTIVGYLGKDPETRHTPQGTAVCSFSVAATERRKDKNGEYQDLTTWLKLTLFGKQAEAAQQYLTKGSQIYAEGRLRLDEYTDREGQKRTTLEMTVSDIQFLSKREQAETAPQRTNTPMIADDDDQSIPF